MNRDKGDEGDAGPRFIPFIPFIPVSKNFQIIKSCHQFCTFTSTRHNCGISHLGSASAALDRCAALRTQARALSDPFLRAL